MAATETASTSALKDTCCPCKALVVGRQKGQGAALDTPVPLAFQGVYVAHLQDLQSTVSRYLGR